MFRSCLRNNVIRWMEVELLLKGNFHFYDFFSLRPSLCFFFSAKHFALKTVARFYSLGINFSLENTYFYMQFFIDFLWLLIGISVSDKSIIAKSSIIKIIVIKTNSISWIDDVKDIWEIAQFPLPRDIYSIM